MTGRVVCHHAEKLGISARAADGDIMAALEEVVDHQVRRGAIPPERRDHAVGWCFAWLAQSDPQILQKYCVHTQAIGAVAAYLDTFPGKGVSTRG
jgi:hypothetical protein